MRTGKKPRPNPKAATDIDAIIGARIRRLRNERGMSQTALAEASAITFQQVQKYEKGTNWVSVSRLAQVAETLGVPLASFFEDVPTGLNDPKRKPAEISVADQLVSTRMGLRLAKAFLSLQDAKLQAKVVALVSTIATGEAAGDDGELH